MRSLNHVLAAACVLLSAAAWAHANLTYPIPRSTNSGIKTGPCGPYPKTNAPTIFTSGQQVNVVWRETVDHPGHYRIAYSAGSPAPDNDFDQHILKDNINNPPGEQATQQTTVTLPNITCDNCTLQLIQVMTDTTPPSNYFSCADFALVAPADAGTDGGSAAADAGVDDAGVGGGADGGSGGGSGAGGGGGGAGSDGGSDGQAGSGGGSGDSGGGAGADDIPGGGASAADGGDEFPEATGGLGCTASGSGLFLVVPGFALVVTVRRARRNRTAKPPAP